MAEYPGEAVKVRCDICGRAGRYRKSRLIERFGDKGLPDVLRDLADCERWGAAGEPCGAHYEDLA
ncbi:hypothetical protein [Rhodovibrio sodomensis]|uniref:hypothetical protein n=1 Tax=Rhodovibrio sodomensis TaxID=1088 RepID=UPI0019060588|nr:hypothetical protein [Rhodovibrio sodomensis]